MILGNYREQGLRPRPGVCADCGHAAGIDRDGCIAWPAIDRYAAERHVAVARVATEQARRAGQPCGPKARLWVAPRLSPQVPS